MKNKEEILQDIEKMKESIEKENDRMISQNEEERKCEEGESCFSTALEGSKIFLKESGILTSSKNDDEPHMNEEKGKCVVEEPYMDEKEFEELYKKMEELREIENDRMIRQNEKERKCEEGNSCFETVMRGSKLFRKVLEK